MTILQENITTSSTIIHGDCLDALKNIPDNSIYGAQNETYIEGWEKRHQTY